MVNWVLLDHFSAFYGGPGEFVLRIADAIIQFFLW